MACSSRPPRWLAAVNGLPAANGCQLNRLFWIRQSGDSRKADLAPNSYSIQGMGRFTFKAEQVFCGVNSDTSPSWAGLNTSLKSFLLPACQDAAGL